ncbi:MAG: hypothetical protein KGJ60_04940 [Verrucomicrobiota bacterium]|nr:hypothetical protein [Verrucomicrobiota bacterium]
MSLDPAFPAGAGPDNVVVTLALQSDGRALIGGYFTNVSGVPQAYLARLDTNGAVDVTFAPKLDTRPSSIQLLPGGGGFIFGEFTNVNGIFRPGLARLLENGALDTSFVPPATINPSVGVEAMAAADGSVFVTGFFTNLSNLPRIHVARLLTDGSVDPAFQSPFTPAQTAFVRAVQANGQPFISGFFTNVAGVATTNLVRLNLDGSVDPSFQSSLSPDEQVSRVLLLPDGGLLVSTAGPFGIWPPLPEQQQLVRLNPDGSVDSTFNVTFPVGGFLFPFGISAMALQADGKILLGGGFLDVNGAPRAKIARLEPDGTLDYCFDVSFSADLYPLALAAESDGGVLVGGSFAGLQGQRHPNLLRLLPATNCAPGVIQMAVPTLTTREDEPEVVVPVVRQGGADLGQTVQFSTRDGSARGGVDFDPVSGTLHFAPGERSQSISIPLFHDNTADGPETFQVILSQPGGGATLGDLTNTTVVIKDFPPGIAGSPDTNYVVRLDGPVQAILPLTDGRAIIAGAFSNVDGQFCPNLARLQPDGARDTNFARAVPLDGDVESLALDAQGRLLVAGNFQHVDGVWQPGLARFESDGSLDASFTPFNGWFTNYYAPQMTAVAVLPDDNIVCGGSVPSGNYRTSALLKFSPSGVLDETFTNQMAASAQVMALLPHSDGDFYALGAGLGSAVVRLHEDGSLDFNFIPRADWQFEFTDSRVGLLPDGRVVAAGFPFPSIVFSGDSGNSQTQPPVWRLNPDGSGDVGFALPATASPWGQLQSVDALSVSPDGEVLIAGYFAGSTNFASTLARLHADGSWDLSFNQGTGLKPRPAAYGYTAVNALEALPAGGWLLGGDFGGYDGFNQPYLVKLSPEAVSQPLTFQFTVTNVIVGETNGPIALEVRRNGDASNPASVTVSTQDGTAVAGLNYQPLDETLAFAPGVWSRTLTVNILDDGIADGTRQFTVALSDPTGGYELAQPDVVTVSVSNDDTAVEFTADQFHAVQQDGFAMAAVKWSGLISTGLQAVVNIVPVTGSASDLGISSLTIPCRFGTNWFRIPITDSPQHGPTREFQLNLVTLGRVIAGPRASAELLLDDLNYPTSPARGVAGVVEAMANAPGGGVYLAGDFTGVNGVPLIRVARLLPDGEVDADFDPGAGPNADVTALAVQPADGKVLIAGDFSAVDGVPRAGLARLETDGSLDASFDPGLGAQSTNGKPFINALLPQSDGSVYVAGDFVSFNDHASYLIAELNASGGVDPTFSSPFIPPLITPRPLPLPPIWYPWTNKPPAWLQSTDSGWVVTASGLTALVQQPDGKLVAAIYPGRLVRLDLDGLLDTSFATNYVLPNPIFDAGSLTLSPEGKLLAGSHGLYPAGLRYWYYAAGVSTNWLAVQQFTANGQADTSFRLRNVPPIYFASSDIRQLLVQPDGRILFSAAIYTNKPSLLPASSEPDVAIIGRLLPDGAWDSSFQMLTCALPLLHEWPGPLWFNVPPLSTPVLSRTPPTASLTLQPNGVLVLAGAFDSVNGQPRRRLARVNPDGKVRGRLILTLTGGNPLRLMLPPEVEAPYVIQTSTDLVHWSDWLEDDYPWWPYDLPLPPDDGARFFRAQPVR